MSDPVLALVLIAGFFLVVTAASYFRTVDSALWDEARIPLIAGAVAGLLIQLLTFMPPPVATGLILTVAALYARLIGRESEPTEGMTLGAMTGAAAAVPAVFTGDHELIVFASAILAGAVAGFGVTFGLTHVRARLRQAGVDAVTAVFAIAAAFVPEFLSRLPRVTERQVAIGAASLIPLLVVITVFKQWPAVAAELRNEAAIGFIDPEDVRATAHPLLRLGRGGWHDARAHREFVRTANRIALRRMQQRSRPEEIARIYQLEVIKLRMQLQEMARIDRAMRLADARHQEAG